jgi:hypothetical protein
VLSQQPAGLNTKEGVMNSTTKSRDHTPNKVVPGKAGGMNKQQETAARNGVAGRHKNDGQQGHRGTR